MFASLPFDRETIEWLDQRTQCFLKAGKPTRISTRPTNSTAGSSGMTLRRNKEYDDQADRDKLAAVDR